MKVAESRTHRTHFRTKCGGGGGATMKWQRVEPILKHFFFFMRIPQWGGDSYIIKQEVTKVISLSTLLKRQKLWRQTCCTPDHLGKSERYRAHFLEWRLNFQSDMFMATMHFTHFFTYLWRNFNNSLAYPTTHYPTMHHHPVHPVGHNTLRQYFGLLPTNA